MGRKSNRRARRQGARTSHGGTAGPGLMLVTVLLLGLLSWPLALGPLLRLAGTVSWRANQCTILASEWRESRGARLSDRRHRLVLRYQFQLDGQTHEGSAVNVTELDGGLAIQPGRQRDQPRADYDVGSTHPCWTEPVPPHRAVLERSVTALPWLLASVLGVLLLASVGAMVRSGRR